jgi:hypothetical protein
MLGSKYQHEKELLLSNDTIFYVKSKYKEIIKGIGIDIVELICVREKLINVGIYPIKCSFKMNSIEIRDECVKFSSVNNNIEMLRKIKKLDFDKEYYYETIKQTAINGHIDVLEWWKSMYEHEHENEHEQIVIHDVDFIDSLCSNGCVDVLNWFNNPENKKIFNVSFDYNRGLSMACLNNNVEILEWYKNNYEGDFRYDYGIDSASSNNNIEVLEWFKLNYKQLGISFNYTPSSLDGASNKGYINIMNWWLNSGFELKFSQYSINGICSNNNVLKWYLKNVKFNILMENINDTNGRYMIIIMCKFLNLDGIKIFYDYCKKNYIEYDSFNYEEIVNVLIEYVNYNNDIFMQEQAILIIKFIIEKFPDYEYKSDKIYEINNANILQEYINNINKKNE